MSETTAAPWAAGQRAVIGRCRVVTIERVTSTGRAFVKGRYFGKDGYEITSGDPYNRAKLELLTPEIEAEMELLRRARQARESAEKAIQDAGIFTRDALSIFGGRIPDTADVDLAERLAAAIRGVMEGRKP